MSRTFRCWKKQERIIPYRLQRKQSSVNILILSFWPPELCVRAVTSVVSDSATLWTVHQVPLSTGFCRQEYWSGSPCPPPGDLPNPGIKPTPPLSCALAGGFLTTSATWQAPPELCGSQKNNNKFLLFQAT